MPDEELSKKKSINGELFIAVLTYVLVSGFLVFIVVLFLRDIPQGNKEILVYMAGQLSGFTGAVVALWTNTTYNSNRKTDLIAKANPVDPHS